MSQVTNGRKTLPTNLVGTKISCCLPPPPKPDNWPRPCLTKSTAQVKRDTTRKIKSLASNRPLSSLSPPIVYGPATLQQTKNLELPILLGTLRENYKHDPLRCYILSICFYYSTDKRKKNTFYLKTNNICFTDEKIKCY